MKISICPAAPYTPEEARVLYPRLAKAGFEALDFGFHNFLDWSDIVEMNVDSVFDLPEKELLAFFAPFREIAEENGLVIGQTHAVFPSYINPSTEEFDKRMDAIVSVNIALTAFLGAKEIVVHPTHDRKHGMSLEDEHRRNIKMYSALIPAAREYGVTVCLENMFKRDPQKTKCYDAACADPFESVAYIDELNDMAGEELFGYCFDSGHAVLCGKEPAIFIKTLGKRLKTLHLHDNRGENDDHMMPYSGITDWTSLVDALREIGYAGNINFETGKYKSQFGYPLPEEESDAMMRFIADIGKAFRAKIQ